MRTAMVIFKLQGLLGFELSPKNPIYPLKNGVMLRIRSPASYSLIQVQSPGFLGILRVKFWMVKNGTPTRNKKY